MHIGNNTIYTQTNYDEYIIREFLPNIDNTELEWHTDNETRLIILLNDTDWKLQIDSSLPIKFPDSIIIPINTYHRVISGNKPLKIKIYKLKD